MNDQSNITSNQKSLHVYTKKFSFLGCTTPIRYALTTLCLKKRVKFETV